MSSALFHQQPWETQQQRGTEAHQNKTGCFWTLAQILAWLTLLPHLVLLTNGPNLGVAHLNVDKVMQSAGSTGVNEWHFLWSPPHQQARPKWPSCEDHCDQPGSQRPTF